MVQGRSRNRQPVRRGEFSACHGPIRSTQAAHGWKRQRRCQQHWQHQEWIRQLLRYLQSPAAAGVGRRLAGWPCEA
ncbi:hypothetical protein VTN96DRAFT_638 [Rasamsonia emersonii]